MHHKYVVWKCNTCWVCRQTTGKPPGIHAHLAYKKRNWCSPCDTVGRYVYANSRNDAIKAYRKGEGVQPNY